MPGEDNGTGVSRLKLAGLTVGALIIVLAVFVPDLPVIVGSGLGVALVAAALGAPKIGLKILRAVMNYLSNSDDQGPDNQNPVNGGDD
jgi:hypothetical protein